MNIFFKSVKYYTFGKRVKTNSVYRNVVGLSDTELSKKPSRTEIINFLLSTFGRSTTYLEIGVRNPEDNYNHVQSIVKYSVDPGVEFENNPVDFPYTSDTFFKKLEDHEILPEKTKFDVIFLDGLHTAEQVNRDIINSFKHLSENGFIVLHDCNPPSEWHAREDYSYYFTPAEYYWSGTVWKAFLKWRGRSEIQSCCVDSDWGVGILSKNHQLGAAINNFNEFFEFEVLAKNRKELLNLVSFSQLKSSLGY